MCGLTGMIVTEKNGLTNHQLNILMTNQFLNQLRGNDSTGVVGITNTGSTSWIKELGGPSRLFSSKLWDDWKSLMYKEGQAMFGHGRAATRGATTIDNAHPFIEDKPDDKGKIILVHNGTLHDYQELDGLKKFDVDSNWLTHCVATHGTKTTFEKVNGPMACIWYDTEEETFNVFRNHERPLVFVKLKSGEYLINSEVAVLMFLRYQFNLQFEREDVKEFKPHTLYTMQMGEIGKGWVTTDLPKVYRVYPGASVRGYDSFLGDDDSEDYYRSWVNRNPGNSLQHNPPWKNETPIGGDRPVIVPHNQWNSLTRGLEADIDHLFARRFRRVEFLARARKTVMAHGEFWTENVSPYRPNLVKLELVDGKVVSSYSDGHGSQWHNTRDRPISLTPQPPAVVTPMLPAPRTDVEVPKTSGDTFCLDTTDFRMGKKKRFKTTLSTGKKIEHWGKVSKNYPRHFEEYWNALDDKLVIGDKVRCEIYDIRDAGSSAGHKCRAARVRSPGDKYVDFYFFDHQQTEKYLENVDFIEGTVQIMRLASQEEWKENGSLVRVLLGNIEFIHTNTDEESVVVVPTGVNPNAV